MARFEIPCASCKEKNCCSRLRQFSARRREREDGGVPLFPWEVEAARGRGAARISETERVNGIVTLYRMAGEGGSCPFFDKEKRICTVYAKRPLACRAFPIARSGILEYLARKNPSPEGELFCMGGIIPKLPRMTRANFIKAMDESLGAQFWQAVQMDLALDFVRSLARQGIAFQDSGEGGRKVVEKILSDPMELRKTFLGATEK